MIDSTTKGEVLPRLKKVAGQIRGIQKMVEDEAYCIDVVNQVTAVRRALESTALILMKRHMESCLTEAIRAKRGGMKINELLDSINHFVK